MKLNLAILACLFVPQVIWADAAEVRPERQRPLAAQRVGGPLGEGLELWRTRHLWRVAHDPTVLGVYEAGIDDRFWTVHPEPEKVEPPLNVVWDRGAFRFLKEGEKRDYLDPQGGPMLLNRLRYHGEHAGKWIEAVSYAQQSLDNARVRAKLDETVRRLLATQKEDGYIGTYPPQRRFYAANDPYAWRSWDPWNVRYVLKGLLAYDHLYPSQQTVGALSRLGDLVVRTFGPGQRSFATVGQWEGLATSTLLESMTRLYARTGERRYLEFAEHMVRTAEADPKLSTLKALLEGKDVTEPGRGKAYELMSALLGYVDLYRFTGNSGYRKAVEHGWERIRADHLYPTGGPWGTRAGGRSAEQFADAALFAPDNGVETCAAVTWVELSLALLRATGESKYAVEAERAVLNAVLGALGPDGQHWATHPPANAARRDYSARLSCCMSSGPRALELFARHLAGATGDGIAINSYLPFEARWGGRTIRVQGDYPYGETVAITIEGGDPARFAVDLIQPGGAEAITASMGGQKVELTARPDGYYRLERTWRSGDAVEVRFSLPLRAQEFAGLGGKRWVAFSRGTVVLARTVADAKEAEKPAPAGGDPARLLALSGNPGGAPKYRVRGAGYELIPYYLAGRQGGGYQSLFPAASTPDAVIDDPLNGSAKGTVEGAGEFAAGGGWRSMGGRIIYDAGRYIEKGSFEAKMRGFTAPAKGAAKSHPIAAWESSEVYDQHREKGSFWMWRIGAADPLKVLAAADGLGTRHEKAAPREYHEIINDGRDHTYRADWSGGKIRFFFDGTLLHEMQFPRLRVRYFTIGIDRSGKAYPQTDPPAIISAVKLIDYGEPEPREPRPEMTIERYSIFERSFEHRGRYANPYKEVTADAVFERHNGEGPRTAPLFWDGDRRWMVRFAPDVPGRWSWTIRSNDPGLNGVSGVFECAPSGRRGAVAPDGSATLRYQSGGDFWLLGDTQWAAFDSDAKAGLDRAAMDRYAAQRASQGFNFVQSVLLARGVNEGGAAFQSLKEETLNPAYWREVDERIRLLNGRGQTVMLALAWGGKHPVFGEFSWDSFPDEAARRRYLRYAAGRFSAFDAGFLVAAGWDLGGCNDERAGLFQRLGRELLAALPHRRLISIHSTPACGEGAVDRFAEEPWMSFTTYRNGQSRLYATGFQAWKARRPRVQAGFGVVGEGGLTGDAARHAMWDVVMTRHEFVTAFRSTHLGGAGGRFGEEVPAEAEFLAWAGHLRRLFGELVPKDNMRGGWGWIRPATDLAQHPFRGDMLLRAPQPRGEDRPGPDGAPLPPKVMYSVLAKPGFGHTSVAYLRGITGTVMLELVEDPAEPPEFAPRRAYSVHRFDPRTGQYDRLAGHKGAGPIPLTLPDGRDWVFTVRRLNPYDYQY